MDHHGEMSRADMLRKLGVAAGAFCGTGLLGPFAERALAVVGESDVDSVDFLLPFEYVLRDYYTQALSGNPRARGELKALFEQLLEAENEHVNAITELVKQLAGTPQKEGDYTFTYINTDEILARAESLEQSAASVYNGVIPMVESPEVRETLGTIAQVEARHSVAILIEHGKPPAPYALEEAYRPYRGLESIEKFTGPEIYRQNA